MDETVIQLLLAYQPLVALVGRRVTPALRDQGEPLPAVVFNLVDGQADVVHDGPSGLSESRIQIDAYAETWDEVKAVSRAVRDCLDGYAGTPEDGVQIQAVLPLSVRDTPPDGTEADPTYRVSMDFTVWAGTPA